MHLNDAGDFAMEVAVLQGSVRRDRMGERAGKWVTNQLKARGHKVVMVDAAKLELPLLDRMWKELKETPKKEQKLTAADQKLHDKLAPLAEMYERVDGFCVVSAEYNHSINPGLTNMIDYFLEEYFFRPSAIVCYSATPFGGVRAAMQLRALLAEVGMPSIPSLQAVPSIGTALSSD